MALRFFHTKLKDRKGDSFMWFSLSRHVLSVSDLNIALQCAARLNLAWPSLIGTSISSILRRRRDCGNRFGNSYINFRFACSNLFQTTREAPEAVIFESLSAIEWQLGAASNQHLWQFSVGGSLPGRKYRVPPI